MNVKIGNIKILSVVLDFLCKEDINPIDYDFGTLTLKKGDRVAHFDTEFDCVEDNTIRLNVIKHEFPCDDWKKNDLEDIDLYDLDECMVYIGAGLEPEFITMFIKNGGCTKAIECKID